MNCLEIYCYSTTIGATEWGHGATALSLCKKPATEQKEWGAGPVKCVDTKDELNPLRNVVYLSPPISTFFSQKWSVGERCQLLRMFDLVQRCQLPIA